jgi:hypothetical protein
MKFEKILWNLRLMRIVFCCCYFYVIAVFSNRIKGQISDTRGKVIVSASVSIYKNHHLLYHYAITDSRVCLQLPLSVLILK